MDEGDHSELVGQQDGLSRERCRHTSWLLAMAIPMIFFRNSRLGCAYCTSSVRVPDTRHIMSVRPKKRLAFRSHQDLRPSVDQFDTRSPMVSRDWKILT